MGRGAPMRATPRRNHSAPIGNPTSSPIFAVRLSRKIDETMADVMEAIGSDTEKTEQFNRLVFVLWHDPHNAEKARQLSQMMDAEINKLIEKDFQKNHH